MGAPPRPIGGSHAVGGALAQAQASGGIAAAVVAVIGRPLPTISGERNNVDVKELDSLRTEMADVGRVPHGSGVP